MRPTPNGALLPPIMNTPEPKIPVDPRPADDDITLSFVVRFMSAAVVVGLVAAAAYSLAIFSFVPDQVGRHGGPALAAAVMLVVYLLLRLGRLRQAVFVLTGGIWAVATIFGFIVVAPNTPILAIYALGLPFLTFAPLSLRGFYALKDTATPVRAESSALRIRCSPVLPE